MSTTPGTLSIAVDTGGTFTDVVAFVGDRLLVVKVPSTPADPSAAVLAGIRTLWQRSGMDPSAGWNLVHGSTVATNALLERRGAAVALVTNAGFEDVLEIGRQQRPQLYALVGHRPPPLVPAERRFGIAGRLDAAGQELAPMDDDELRALAARLGEERVSAVAICLLHSYANPAHEEKVAAALAAASAHVSVSSRLLPEHREYERTATTVVNAYVAPVMDQYLGSLDESAGADRIRIMGSAGGALPVRRARAEPIQTVLSGPAGGVIGAIAAARRHGLDHLISFDMGGTSTDVSLVPGQPLHTREFTIGGTPVAVPVLDIHTVGAGGGSIARLDAGGALRVGPESAGADPGPICYGRGGRAITVTDANVWLGTLPAAAWAHGSSPGSGNPGLLRSAIEVPLTALAHRMGASEYEAAAGIVAIADTAMEGALRVISVERGYDPADFIFVPFGGAAGLHAVELARRLGIPRILVPQAPGALSAVGMLGAPIRRLASRTLLEVAISPDELDLRPVLAELEREALAAMAEDGFDSGSVRLDASLDARYRGQSFELTVPAADWLPSFHEAHRRRYGHARPGEAVQVVLVRVEAVAAVPQPEPTPRAAAPTGSAPDSSGMQRVWHDGAFEDARHYERERLRSGHRVAGPAIVTEYSATFWLPRGWAADVLHDGALLLEPS